MCGTIAGTIQIFSDAEINASKTITITNKSFFYSNIARSYKVILSKGKYRIEGAGGKTGDFVEYASSADSTRIYTYIDEKFTTIFTANVNSSNSIEYTANSDTELQISIGKGAEGCYNMTAGGNCSNGYYINAGDGYVQITTIE